MNQRVSTVLVVALLLSGGATYLVYRLLVAKTSRAAQPTTQVVLASKPLAIGTLIRDEDLRNGGWVGTPPAGAVQKKESIVGRGVIAPIYEGEVVVDTAAGAFRDMTPADPEDAVAQAVLPNLPKWRFRPSARDNQPVEVEVLLVIPPES